MPTLMVSISGIRGIVGDGFSPELVAKYASAFGEYCDGGKVILGRDTRPTGWMVRQAVISGLCAAGCEVVDVGVVPTPTVAVLVEEYKAQGGICITASHNPMDWNALKFFHGDGLFLDPEQSKRHLAIADRGARLVPWDQIGNFVEDKDASEVHVRQILDLDLVDVSALRKRNFRVALDCVNGAGRLLAPHLLQELGCDVVKLGVENTGLFSRGPEPTPANLKQLCDTVKQGGFDVGFALDPDADRLAIVDGRGEPLGEELTLALAARFVLRHEKSDVVVNVSTSQVMDDVCAEAGVKLHRTRVGEINVSVKMREIASAIGGEGNGGVILRDLHLGRDSLVGMALILQYMLETGSPVRTLRDELPTWDLVKDKVSLDALDPQAAVEVVREMFSEGEVDETDGLKISFEREGKAAWVQVRASNTEPILRIFAEAAPGMARQLVNEIIERLKPSCS
jgi:phosphomannomutase